MQDHVVTELNPTRPIAGPVELHYSLTEDDYVAYWVCLACFAEMPTRARVAMRDMVGVFCGVAWMVGLFLSAVLCAVYPPVGFPCLIGVVFGFGFGFAFAFNRIDNRPSTCFQGWLSKPYRWLCLRALRRLAHSDVQDGTLDAESHYRFAMNAEGFMLATTLVVSPMDPGRVAVREDRVPWPALRDAAFDEGHAFLIIRKDVAAIIPRRCFADSADFDRFVALVRCYHEGTGVERSSTAICSLDDRLTSRTPR
jgi:hypothetical protein